MKNRRIEVFEEKKVLDKEEEVVYYMLCRLKDGMTRGGAVWQLVGLITRRSWVQVPPPQPYGSVAQLARAFGSYPECHRFESYLSHYPEALKNKGSRVFLCPGIMSIYGVFL